MSDAYKIIHNFMAFIASPDFKNKVWTWLLDPFRQTTEKKKRFFRYGTNIVLKQMPVPGILYVSFKKEQGFLLPGRPIYIGGRI